VEDKAELDPDLVLLEGLNRQSGRDLCALLHEHVQEHN